MNYRKINIIEFPSNLGLKKKESDPEPGVKKLPQWLEQHGFHQGIEPEKILRIEPPKYSMTVDQESGVLNAQKIIDYSIKQCQLLTTQLNGKSFQLILGGDCSILIGNSLALKQLGNCGLFFLDGHTDYITPEISTTGGAAGMDLAIVTGYGHPKLTNILNLGPYFEEKQVFCIGNREYHTDYVRSIQESEINYFDLTKLREKGFKTIVSRFLDMVVNQNLDGFFVHLDVDVLNDRIMPAVDSRAEDGLWYPELSQVLKPLLSSEKAIGIEITILDPNLDVEGKYTREFANRFVDIFRGAKIIPDK